MSGASEQFPFVARDPALGSASLAPMMPITLQAARNVVGYTKGARAKATARFTAILGDNLRSALPGLIAGIEDDDKATREMCLEYIGLAGVSAGEALPALKQALYLAPQNEGRWIAKALGELGPPGIAVLEGATKCGNSAAWGLVESIRSSKSV